MPVQSLKHMVHSFSIPNNPELLSYEDDRRNMLRVDLPFPALVRGVDRENQVFEERTVLDNISSTGLALRLVRGVQEGARLFLVVRLSTDPDDTAPAPRVALLGVVQRTQPNIDGTCTLAIMFTHYRFLYANGI